MAGCRVGVVFHPIPPIESLRSVESYSFELVADAAPRLNIQRQSEKRGSNAGSANDQEEQLLFPIRAPSAKNVIWRVAKTDKDPKARFRPDMLPPDIINVELEFVSSTLHLYGTLFRLLWFFKDDFLGEYQSFHDMENGWREFLDTAGSLNQSTDCETPLLKRKQTPAEEVVDGLNPSKLAGEMSEEFEPRKYRPLMVTVSFVMHDIQGTLLTVS
jgi:hypothetical protein